MSAVCALPGMADVLSDWRSPDFVAHAATRDIIIRLEEYMLNSIVTLKIGFFQVPVLLLALTAVISMDVPAQDQGASNSSSSGTWKFAVSGDSRNCGNIVMPAIAQGVLKDGAAFYWHLGDYRAIYMFDEDFRQANPNAVISDYLNAAWPDFIQHQLEPFRDLPVFLALGNHEMIPPKSRAEAIQQFADWFDAPVLRRQRLADNPADHLLKTYYHWIDRGVDFITMDNASPDQFDLDQMAWFASVLQAAARNPDIRTVVLGMHASLPGGLSTGHSMNDSPQQQESGQQVYTQLVNFRRATRKNVYVLASHSHFVLNNIYATACHPGEDVLPGWIMGSAGAVRYRLPQDHKAADVAMTDVYGYLLATVSRDGTISFEFRQIDEPDVPREVVKEFSRPQVHWCFAENKSPFVPAGASCSLPATSGTAQ